ncbi:PQQ-binding-like beta-propeller repeat protein [Streptomyces mobaraensis]|uniref:PQQ-binding-like beta-propeller repeat protein n=1 Tax=Streptomyces mobaraensis TaxID=35621 RepID=A0A5N5WFG2_STRMB|nr:PQQ-binding-like beta-propeller repeat protein [Streptomyces mobaraensis]KAB7851138.1 PQQ-binding-like beta-propeller repeat protein [Streptomyces mobaraensis]
MTAHPPPFTVEADTDAGLWTLSVPGDGLGFPGIAGDAVYVPVGEDQLAAVDARTGRIRWCAGGITEPDAAGAVRAGRAVVVPTAREHSRSGFTALDAATGEVLWKRRKSRLNRPAAAGSAVVLWNDSEDDRSTITGVDGATGETLWEDEYDRIYSLLVRGDLVVLDTASHRALDARTGAEIWHGGGAGTLLAENGPSDAAVFHAWHRFGSLTRHATRTGEELGRVSFPPRVLKPSPYVDPVLVGGGRALFSESFGRRVRVYAYGTGRAAWPVADLKLGLRRFSTFRGPAVCVDDWAYVVTWRDRLYGADVTGRRGLRRLATTAPDGTVLKEPKEITAGPRHVFVSGDGTVAGLREGHVLWVAATNRWSHRIVPLGPDRVLFPSTDGRHSHLHCADAETGRRIG